MLNSVKKAVGCNTPQGISTVPTSTARWYSIIVIMRCRATRQKAITTIQYAIT
jgi:hypothetical protein